MGDSRFKHARFIFDNSLLLLPGAIAAVAWANLDLVSYDRMTHPLQRQPHATDLDGLEVDSDHRQSGDAL